MFRIPLHRELPPALLVACLSVSSSLWADTSENSKQEADPSPLAAQQEKVDRYIEQKTAERSLYDKLREFDQLQNYQSVKSNLAPFSTEEILEMRRILQRVDVANNKPLNQAVGEDKTVAFRAGEFTQFDLVPGMMSILMFFDQYGAPWPIQFVTLGDDAHFKVSQDPSSPHVLLLQTNNSYSQSNLIVLLKDFATPANIKLHANPERFNPQVQVRLDALGPNSHSDDKDPSTIATQPSEIQLNFLNGTPPLTAIPLKMTLRGSEGWFYNEKYYIRSQATLLSPPFISQLESPSGYTLYQIDPAHHLVMALHGKMIDVEALYED